MSLTCYDPANGESIDEHCPINKITFEVQDDVDSVELFQGEGVEPVVYYSKVTQQTPVAEVKVSAGQPCRGRYSNLSTDITTNADTSGTEDADTSADADTDANVSASTDVDTDADTDTSVDTIADADTDTGGDADADEDDREDTNTT